MRATRGCGAVIVIDIVIDNRHRRREWVCFDTGYTEVAPQGHKRLRKFAALRCYDVGVA